VESIWKNEDFFDEDVLDEGFFDEDVLDEGFFDLHGGIGKVHCVSCFGIQHEHTV
jgi:hypothetical protein